MTVDLSPLVSLLELLFSELQMLARFLRRFVRALLRQLADALDPEPRLAKESVYMVLALPPGAVAK